MKDKNDLLNYAIENGIIDLKCIKQQIKMKEESKILSEHPYKIWKGNNDTWYTYLPDKERGRVLKKRSTEEKINQVVIEYWKKEKEKHTIEDVFYEWVEEKLKYGEIEKATYDRYETDFIRFFNEDFREMDIKYVTEDMLEDFIKTTIKEKSLTSKAYSGLRTIIIGIFRYAKKHNYSDISIYVFFGDLNLSKKIFVKKIKNKENEVFTEAEIKMIISHIDIPNAKIRDLGILLAIHTGLRPGELSALKLSDVNLKERTIYIQRSEIRYKDDEGKCVIDVRNYPKTESGVRYLLLNDKGLDVVKRIIALNPFGKFLFQDEKTGKRISENGFNHRLRRVCNAVKIPVRTMHKLRKTYGTILLDRGVNDSIIMEQMGHADIKTTRQYYYYCNHVQEKKIEQLNKASIG